MSKKLHQTKNLSHSKNINLALIPLIIIIAIIPLIVRLKVYNAGLSGYSWFSSNDTKVDFFLYYKSVSFTFISSVVAIVLIWAFIKQKFLNIRSVTILKENGGYKKSIAFIPLAAYGVLALLSTVFSNYSSFGYSGIFEQFETIFVLLGYCLIVYYAFLVVKSEEDVRVIIKWLIVGVLILCILGFTQAIGTDFFTTTFGKKLIVPSEHWNLLDELKFEFENNRVYLTLYNPNYVGLYTALVLPIFLVLLLFAKDRKLQFVYAFAIIGLFVCMIASLSRNGFVALCVSFIFIFVFFRKFLISHWKISLSAFSFILIGFLIINAYMGNIFINRLQSMFTDVRTPAYPLSSIITNDNNIEITYNNNKLYIQSELTNNNVVNLKLKDAKNIPIQINLDESTSTYSIIDPRFSTFQIQQVQLGEINGFSVIIDGYSWIFTNDRGDNTYYYFNSLRKFDKIINADSSLFTEYEKLGSSRGYIWSRTIPLLKNKIVLGSGADTFSLVYPHSDYIGRFHNGYISSITTKPHNMYLQMAVQTGVLSLIAFLTFYIMYFISCIKLYFRNNFDNYFDQIGVAIFVGTIGYMVSGLFNDSTITVSPIFWVLMGVGMAVNHKINVDKV